MSKEDPQPESEPHSGPSRPSEPDWDDEPESGDDDAMDEGTEWWGHTQIEAAIRDARRRGVNPQKAFVDESPAERKRSLKFPTTAEKKPASGNLLARLWRKFF